MIRLRALVPGGQKCQEPRPSTSRQFDDPGKDFFQLGLIIRGLNSAQDLFIPRLQYTI